MKTRVLITFGLASIVVLFGSFMVREKEEALKPSVDYYLLQDKAFTTFVGNLKKMEALVYVPKSKITDTKSAGLSVFPRDKAMNLNKEIAGSIEDWVLVIPSEKADKDVILNFEKMKILTFVRRENVNPKLIDQMQMKVDPDTLDIEELTGKIDATRVEELQLKWDDSKVWQSYVPVTVR